MLKADAFPLSGRLPLIRRMKGVALLKITLCPGTYCFLVHVRLLGKPLIFFQTGVIG